MIRKKILLIFFLFFISFFHLQGQEGVASIECSLANIMKLTMNKSPAIKRQQLFIDRSKADRQARFSSFNYLLSSELSYSRNRSNLFQEDGRFGVLDGRIQTNQIGLGGSVQRLFETGMSASAGINFARTSDNIPFDNFGNEIGRFIGNNNPSINLSVLQPLLKGKGRLVTTASVRAADIDIEKNTLNNIFTSSSELVNAALAYWQYVASYKSLEIFRENERRVQRVLEVTNDLVEAGKKPASDLIQIRADLADKEGQTISSAQRLYDGRLNLGRSIGLNFPESMTIGEPIDGFPELESSGYSDDLDLDVFIQLVHTHRTDLKALKKSKESLEILLDQAENSLQPQLDLLAFLNYGGSKIGKGVHDYLSPLVAKEGRNMHTGFTLRYMFPLKNDFAKASLAQNKIAIMDQQVLIDNQIRNIELNVSIALNNLRTSVQLLEKNRETYQYYEEVFSNEQQKFQNGLTTLLNLILFQERLTFAQLDYIVAQQIFSIAIVNLRHETGTLLPEESLTFPDQDVFFRLPRID